MRTKTTIIAFCLGTVGAANVASAQTVEEPLCFETADDCNNRFPGEYEGTAAPNHPTEACTSPTHVTSRRTCDASRLRRRVCGPPTVTPGPNANSITVTCGEGAPRVAGPTHTRVSRRLVVVCLPNTGIRPNGHGGCEPIPGISSQPVYVVRVSVERADGRLVEELNLDRDAMRMTYSGITFGAGATPAAGISSELATALQTLVDTQPGIDQAQNNRLDGHDQELDGIHQELARPSTAESAVRADLGVGYYHLRVFGGSDLDGIGLTGSILRHRRNRPVGVLLQGFAGMAFQPLTPGQGPLWTASLSAQLNINLVGNMLRLNLGPSAGTVWRFGKAGLNEITGTTAWWLAFNIGPEVNISVNGDDPNASLVTLRANFMVGVAQTWALAGSSAVAPLGVPVGANVSATWTW